MEIKIVIEKRSKQSEARYLNVMHTLEVSYLQLFYSGWLTMVMKLSDPVETRSG